MFKKDLAWIKLTPPIPPEQRNRSSSTAKTPKKKVVEIMPRATCFDLNRDDFAAIGYEDGFTQIWDLRTIQSMVKLLDPFDDRKENAGRVVNVRWSKTNEFHVFVLHPQHVFVWDLKRPILDGPIRIVHLKDYSNLVVDMIPVRSDLFLLLRQEEQRNFVLEKPTDGSTKRKRRKLDKQLSSVCCIKDMSSPSSTIERVNLFNDGDQSVVSVIFIKEENSILAVRSDCTLVLISVSEPQRKEIIDSTNVISSTRRGHAVGARLYDDSTLVAIWCSTGVIVVFDLKARFRVEELSDVVARTKFTEVHARDGLVIGLANRLSRDVRAGSGTLYWERGTTSHAIMHHMTEPGRTGLKQLKLFRREHKRNVLLALTHANNTIRRGTGASSAAALEGEASVFLLMKRYERTWHGPFFSPDFEVLTANEIYREKENEFDVETSSSSKETEVEKVTNAIEDGERVDVMNREKPENFVPVEVIQQEFTAKQKGYKDWDGKALKLWS